MERRGQPERDLRHPHQRTLLPRLAPPVRLGRPGPEGPGRPPISARGRRFSTPPPGSASPVTTPETPDTTGMMPRLSEEQLDVLGELGQRRRTRVGEVLVNDGDVIHEFLVVLEGKVAVVDAYGTPAERVLAVHARGRVLGELGLVIGQPSFLRFVVVEQGEMCA